MPLLILPARAFLRFGKSVGCYRPLIGRVQSIDGHAHIAEFFTGKEGVRAGGGGWAAGV